MKRADRVIFNSYGPEPVSVHRRMRPYWQFAVIEAIATAILIAMVLL